MTNNKLDQLLTNPFLRLDTLLADIPAPANMDIINMSIGEPQLPPPEIVTDILSQHKAEWGKYSPGKGIASFRVAVCDWLNKKMHIKLDPEKHIQPTAGSREGLFLTGLAAVPDTKNGKKPIVIVPDPFYQAYMAGGILSGAEVFYAPSPQQNNFLVDLKSISPEIYERTALMYLCNPTNPHGAIADENDIRTAIQLARQHDFTLVVDECYHEIYHATSPVSALTIAHQIDGTYNNVVVSHSLSKRSCLPGLRSAFVAGDEKIIAALLKIITTGAVAVPTPVLKLSEQLWPEPIHVEKTRAYYQQNVNIARDILGDLPGYHHPQAGFFLWLGVKDGEQTTREIWRKTGVKLVPGKYLSYPDQQGNTQGDHFVRIALVWDQTTTQKALQRIKPVLKDES